jgi:hypothetical protein
VSEIIAYCGLNCQTCPIYLATRTADENEQAQMRNEIARLCREHYGVNYSPEDISDCDGCFADTGRLFVGCRDCPIRKCALERGVKTCADCGQYVCANLAAHFSLDPTAKDRLDEIRRNLR